MWVRTSKSLSDVALKSVAKLPFKWMHALSGSLLVVPYYHMVSDAFVPHVSHLYRFRTVAEFTADLKFFLRHFEPITLSDIVGALNGTRPLSRPCFHLTFDDGFREIYDVVGPVLQRAGVPATFFLNTAFLDGGGLAHHNVISILLDALSSSKGHSGKKLLERVESVLPPEGDRTTTLRERILATSYARRSILVSLAQALEVDLDEYVKINRPYLTSEQVETLLRAGFNIGAHSHDHPLYKDLSLADQLSQTRTSIQLLEARFGLSPKAFAFPHTDTGVKDAFFNTVFSESLLDVSFGTGGLLPHSHPRNIERVGMEKTSATARQILVRQFVRAAQFRLQRKIYQAQVAQRVATPAQQIPR
jgi:peptidoglycan/xylan/chitin deacetylase (PgdA/CDA1 family)